MFCIASFSTANDFITDQTWFGRYSVSTLQKKRPALPTSLSRWLIHNAPSCGLEPLQKPYHQTPQPTKRLWKLPSQELNASESDKFQFWGGDSQGGILVIRGTCTKIPGPISVIGKPKPTNMGANRVVTLCLLITEWCVPCLPFVCLPPCLVPQLRGKNKHKAGGEFT